MQSPYKIMKCTSYLTIFIFALCEKQETQTQNRRGMRCCSCCSEFSFPSKCTAHKNVAGCVKFHASSGTEAFDRRLSHAAPATELYARNLTKQSNALFYLDLFSTILNLNRTCFQITGTNWQLFWHSLYIIVYSVSMTDITYSFWMIVIKKVRWTKGENE